MNIDTIFLGSFAVVRYEKLSTILSGCSEYDEYQHITRTSALLA